MHTKYNLLLANSLATVLTLAYIGSSQPTSLHLCPFSSSYVVGKEQHKPEAYRHAIVYYYRY